MIQQRQQGRELTSDRILGRHSRHFHRIHLKPFNMVVRLNILAHHAICEALEDGSDEFNVDIPLTQKAIARMEVAFYHK